MPFKNFSSPRKINQLDAEVRASAIHANPELVAVLTNDPVRLAVHPTWPDDQGGVFFLSLPPASPPSASPPSASPPSVAPVLVPVVLQRDRVRLSVTDAPWKGISDG